MGGVVVVGGGARDLCVGGWAGQRCGEGGWLSVGGAVEVKVEWGGGVVNCSVGGGGYGVGGRGLH